VESLPIRACSNCSKSVSNGAEGRTECLSGLAFTLFKGIFTFTGFNAVDPVVSDAQLAADDEELEHGTVTSDPNVAAATAALDELDKLIRDADCAGCSAQAACKSIKVDLGFCDGTSPLVDRDKVDNSKHESELATSTTTTSPRSARLRFRFPSVFNSDMF